MTGLSLSGKDFTNLRQYYLSKLFQLSPIAVNGSLVDGAFLGTIKKIPHKCPVGFRSEHFDVKIINSICFSWRKTLISFNLCDKMNYRPEKWLYHHQTNFLSIERENYPSFRSTNCFTCIHAYTCIYIYKFMCIYTYICMCIYT